MKDSQDRLTPSTGVYHLRTEDTNHFALLSSYYLHRDPAWPDRKVLTFPTPFKLKPATLKLHRELFEFSYMVYGMALQQTWVLMAERHLSTIKYIKTGDAVPCTKCSNVGMLWPIT